MKSITSVFVKYFTIFIILGLFAPIFSYDLDYDTLQEVKQLYIAKKYRKVMEIYLSISELEPETDEEEEVLGEIARIVEDIKKDLYKNHILKAHKFLKEGKIEPALKEASYVLSIDPENQYAMEIIEIAFQKKVAIKEQAIEAKKLIKEGKIKEAKKIMKEIKKEVPYAPEIEEIKTELFIKKQEPVNEKKAMKYRKNARLYMEWKKWDQAIKNWEKVLEYLPNDQEAIDGIEYALRMKKEEERLKQELEKEAFIKKQISTHYNLAKEYESKKQYHKAIDEYENMLVIVDEKQWDKYPKLLYAKKRIEELKNLLAKIEREKEKKKQREFMKYFEKGLYSYLNKDYSSAVYNFGKCLEIIPEHKLAKRYYKLSLDARKIEDEVRVNPDSPMYPLVVSLKRLAKQYMKKGFKKNNELLIKKSIKYWLSILRLFPRNEEANLNLLKCYAKINRELYKAYIKSLLDKARKYIKNKDIIRAKDTLRIVEKFEPNNPLVKKYLHKIKKQKEIVEKPKVPKELISKRYRMGILAYQRGDLQTALKHFRWIVSVEPNNVLASSNLAKVEALLGIKKKKQQKELPLEKKLLVKRLFNQAVRYYIAGKYRLAKTIWKKVLKIYPQHQPSIQSLRKVKALLGG